MNIQQMMKQAAKMQDQVQKQAAQARAEGTAGGGAVTIVPGMSREQRILATIACHSAVKLGDRLSHQEMEALIRDWLRSRYPATCPHGRRDRNCGSGR